MIYITSGAHGVHIMTADYNKPQANQASQIYHACGYQTGIYYKLLNINKKILQMNIKKQGKQALAY
jgi:hypothetical protein